MDLGLSGKVAVITGASVGIGLAVAEGLAAEGVHLVMAARQAERLTREAARIAQKRKLRTVPVACDVATAAGTAALVEAAEARPDPDAGLDQDRQATHGRKGRRLGSLSAGCGAGARADRPFRLARGA